ncbi:hypothetical protein SGFS_004140 [Streptomyces graminofaciens]|uniref:Uncharacterized protein n=1 Tax=Streptomyces graminofaciens TaxID=68212 RepID=A0ABM7F0R5_9ACTN|nr:hypothetical protein SGFS_004140 [Streptomyces graminofaciens]
MITAADTGDRTAAQDLLKQVTDAHHCLARDYERCTTSAEAMVYWSMTMVMTRRLAGHAPREREPAWRGRGSQPRETRRFAFDCSAFTRAATASMPNKTAISWQVNGPDEAGPCPRGRAGCAGSSPTASTRPAPHATSAAASPSPHPAPATPDDACPEDVPTGVA